ncbi:hypothetical protein Pmar_PMAR007760 [Perkinsus marinus ATCC 50983]|uniref:Membrane transport protein MMPL domain-containing protein n=1 Tax=Perkinsus marinus (strain ATCC 50983 / TXsc) TaxID=423536 RepID=C5KYS4_PERM5|nr:hypothetical protein Pmar_PMAR007760 [Perkinsus marinus ATCC 50983]EER10352.1 hypothetical protein Pmar_PMAR007760 [Perkinsus marinus ATCC 50983]|eukprot:XP_002778557.1 hypothetical protein Pmar_PMAR007760 [Perkinsus marinus ATCC 50983]
MKSSCINPIKQHAVFVGKYLQLLHLSRYVLIPMWLVLFGLGVVGVTHMFDHMTSALDSPAGSPSYAATQRTSALFPQQQFGSPEVLLVSLDGGSPGDLFTNGLLHNLTETVRHAFPANMKVQIDDYLQAQQSGEPTILYLSADNRTTIFTVAFDIGLVSVAPLEEAVADAVRGSYGHLGLFVGWAGIGALGDESAKVTELELGITHAVVLPLAFLLLAYSLRSWRLLLLPLICLLLSIAICGACLYLLSLLMPVNTGAPIMMFFLLMALCVDYSLILLTRFREEVTGVHQRSPYDACKEMLEHSGHVVFSSGSILFVCFVWLMIIPIALFRSIGLALLISALCAVSVNLSVTPTLIVTFPKFFGHFGGKSCCRCWSWCRCRRRDDRSEGQSPRGRRRRSGPGFWYKWGKLMTSRWAAVASIILLVTLIAVFGWACSSLTITSNISTASPRDSRVGKTSERISMAFTPGMSGPFNMVFEAPGGDIFTEKFWTAGLNLCRTIDQKLMKQHPKGSLLGSMYLKEPGMPATEIDFNLAKLLVSPSCTDPRCKQYQEGLKKSMSPGRNALKVTLIVDDAPTSLQASSFTESLRDVIDTVVKESDGELIVWLTGISVSSHDSMSAVVESLPAFAAATIAVCLVLVGIVYRSLLIAVRGVITIAVTLVFSFGFAAGVYLNGWLQFLHWPAVASESSTDGLSWIALPLAFSVVLGLSLDYDVFLLGRIVEEHDRGASDKTSVIIGVWKAGKVVALAGCIMTITFCGLLFSSTPMVNQTGFILVTAIILDAFFMQGVVTPSLVSFFGKANWWPRGCPPIHTPEDDVLACREDIDSAQIQSDPQNLETPNVKL